MLSNDELLQSLMEKVSEQMVESIKHDLMENVVNQVVSSMQDSIRQSLEREISKNMSKTLLEGEFYRRINTDLQSGLKQIYKEIAAARQGGSEIEVPSGGNTDELLSEATDQLDKVLQTTEKAAVEIMDIVERLQEMQTTLGRIIQGFESGGVKKEDRQELGRINETLGMDLLHIMTSLSFQDLTGQRIKLIVNTLRKIESIVLELYMTTGIKIKTREKTPEKNLEQIDAEASQTVSDLKGPTMGTNQNDVDDLLANLGLD